MHEKEDDLDECLGGQLFTNNETGIHSRDSDWKGADARKRHRMDVLLGEAKREGGIGSLRYHGGVVDEEGATECFAIGGPV